MNGLTIIIPIYNAEQYIRRCLDSIVNNTEMLDEVILIDDGSKDSSAAICKEYQDRYGFIQYFYQENAGPSAARNRGLEIARGEYVMFVDCDDYVGDLSEVQRTLKAYNSDYYIFPNIYKIDRRNQYLDTKEQAYTIETGKHILKKMVVCEKINSPCSKVYKREILHRNGIRFQSAYDMAEDLLFNMEYINCCNNFIVNDAVIYFYCFNNSESLTQKYIQNKYDVLMAVNGQLKQIFDKLEIPDMYDYLVYKNTFSSIKDFGHRDCQLSKQEKYAKIKFYKKNTPKKFIFKYGLKMTVWSIIFCVCPARFILSWVK